MAEKAKAKAKKPGARWTKRPGERLAEKMGTEPPGGKVPPVAEVVNDPAPAAEPAPAPAPAAASPAAEPQPAPAAAQPAESNRAVYSVFDAPVRDPEPVRPAPVHGEAQEASAETGGSRAVDAEIVEDEPASEGQPGADGQPAEGAPKKGRKKKGEPPHSDDEYKRYATSMVQVGDAGLGVVADVLLDKHVEAGRLSKEEFDEVSGERLTENQVESMAIPLAAEMKEQAQELDFMSQFWLTAAANLGPRIAAIYKISKRCDRAEAEEEKKKADAKKAAAAAASALAASQKTGEA